MNGTYRFTIPGKPMRERILWHTLIHVVNHGTQHRSEAVAILTGYGQSPGELDFNSFCTSEPVNWFLVQNAS